MVVFKTRHINEHSLSFDLFFRHILYKTALSSLCTDVPPPSEKIGRRESLFSRFFLREGGRLYTGYALKNP